MPSQHEIEDHDAAPDFYTIQTQTGWGRTLSHFADWCAPQLGWRVLDVGCGPGLLPRIFQERGCSAVGVDIDSRAFLPHPLYPTVLIADGSALPFVSQFFHLVTASNVLFLSKNPAAILQEIARVLTHQGQAAFLNPSERMSRQEAERFVDQRQLTSEARQSFLNWAERAERYHRWNERDLEILFESVGLKLAGTSLQIGPGLARFARAIKA